MATIGTLAAFIVASCTGDDYKAQGLLDQLQDGVEVVVPATKPFGGTINSHAMPHVGMHVKGKLLGTGMWETSSVVSWVLEDTANGIDVYAVETRNTRYTVRVK